MTTKHRSSVTFGQSSYVFRPKEQDLVVDELRTIVDDHGANKGDVRKIHESTDIAQSTVYKLWSGKTLHPRHATLARIAGYYGYTFKLVRDNGAPAETRKSNGTQLRKRFPQRKGRANRLNA